MRAGLFSLILTLLPLGAVAATAPPVTISVGGSGTVTMVPDQATVQASVVTTAQTASDAVSQNNRAYALIVDAVTRAGITRSDIALTYYNVNYVRRPIPPATPQPYERYGYTVSRSFSIKVRHMDRAGAIVDAATHAGATNIDGVFFGLADAKHAREIAAQRAVADARAKAEALATAAGLHLRGVMSITMDTGSPVHPLVMRAMAASVIKQPATVLDPGSVTVSADVSVVYGASP